MTEPATTAAGAHIVGSGILIAGVATGLPADLIFPAFVGALWSLRGMDEAGPWGCVLQVIAGTLLAAWMAAPVTLLAGDILPQVNKVPDEMLRYPIAFGLGWGGLSIAMKRITSLIGGAK